MQEGIFKTIGMCFVLCTAVLFVYSPVQQYDFISFDDYSYVVNNQHIQQGITLESIAWALTAVCEATWQPLVWLSYMIDYQLYGLDPGGYHLTNVLLHIGNVLLLFMLLQKMTGAFWKPAWVAALFALHPIHVESVAWIAERKDVLSTLMLLLTVLSYAGYVKRPGCLGYLRTCLLFLLGLMSKPMLVTLPFVLLLLDFWPLGRFDSSGESGFAWCRRRVVQLVIEKVPLFSIAAGSAVLTWWAQQDAGAVSSLEAVPLGVRFLNALMSYVLYMGNMVWPSGLAVFYPYSAKLPVLALWGSGALLSVITFAAILALKRCRYVAVGWFWYLGTLVPVIGIVQIGGHALADRFVYIPFIGLYIVIVWGVAECCVHRKFNSAGIACGIILLGLLVLTASKQVSYWKNTVTVFKHAISVTENNYIAHRILARTLRKQGKLDEAIKHFRASIRIKPGNDITNLEFALALEEQGNTVEAVKHYERALKRDPDILTAHFNSGCAYLALDNVDKAIAHFIEALRIQPDYVQAHCNLGQAYEKAGKVQEALQQYEEALRDDPDSVKVRFNFGLLLAKQGRYEDAFPHFQAASTLEPDYIMAHVNCGIVLVGQGKLKEAVPFFQEALRLDPDHAQARSYLSQAVARLGVPKT